MNKFEAFFTTYVMSPF